MQVCHSKTPKHAELAYILEILEQPREAQRELGIGLEASYIVSVVNPKMHSPKRLSKH